jgi:hypothetical protein
MMITALVVAAVLAQAEPKVATKAETARAAAVSTPSSFDEFAPEQKDGAAVDVASAMLCGDAAIRAESKDDIAQEKKYAREGGGVVDAKQIYDDQDTMRHADDDAKRVKRWFAKVQFKRSACDKPNVKALLGCMGHTEVPEGISWVLNPGNAACDGLPAQIVQAGIERVSKEQ